MSADEPTTSADAGPPAVEASAASADSVPAEALSVAAVAVEPSARDGAVESPEETAEPPISDVSVPPAGPLDGAEVGARLKALFPALFRGQPRPLKLRIQTDIQQRTPGVFTRQSLAAFFRRHTSSTGYLIALTRAPNRYDLDGQPAGELADEHRRLAQEELDRRRGNREQREELLEQQRRNRATLLRDYERTTLTRANFCVLKGVEEGELDGLLELAREELKAFVPPPQRPVRPTSGDRRDGQPRQAQRRR